MNVWLTLGAVWGFSALLAIPMLTDGRRGRCACRRHHVKVGGPMWDTRTNILHDRFRCQPGREIV